MRIIRISNSQGVRIPKLLLEQIGLSGEVCLAVSGNTIIIVPLCTPGKAGQNRSEKWLGVVMMN